MAPLTDSQLSAIAKSLRDIAGTIDSAVVTPAPTPDPVPAPVPTPEPTPAPVPVPDSRFALVVDEQFAAGKLDSKTWWAPYDGVDGTAGIGTRKASLVTFRDGNLIIAAERPSKTTYDHDKFTTAGVAAGPKAQTYGRYEVRQKASKGAGFWPNLQLWPTAGKQPAKYNGKDGWPETIEVDIAESPKADRSEALTTIHFGPDNKQKGSSVKADFTQFHIWTVEWTPEALVFFLDGKEIRRVTDKAQIPTTPHHLVVQSDAGKWAGTPTSTDPTRVEIEIDFIRQWKYNG